MLGKLEVVEELGVQVKDYLHRVFQSQSRDRFIYVPYHPMFLLELAKDVLKNALGLPLLLFWPDEGSPSRR